MRYFSTIRSKYLLILYLVILVPIIALVGFSYYYSFRLLIDYKQETQRNSLISFRNMVAYRHMEDMERVLGILGNDPQLYRMTTNDKIAEEILADWALVMDLYPYRAWVYYGDNRNRIVVYPDWTPDDDYDLRERPWYINSLNQDGIVWSPPFLEYVSGKVVLTASKAVYHQGEMQGVIAIDTFLEDFLTLFQMEIQRFSEVLLLVDQDHQVIASNYDEFQQIELPMEDILSESVTEIALFDESYLISHITIPPLEWHLLGLLPQRELLEDTRAIQISIGVILAASIVLAGFVAYVLSSYITGNIKRINDYMAQIMEGDYQIRYCVKGNDEFHHMNRQLNDMTSKLANSITTAQTLMQLLSHSVSNTLTSCEQRLMRIMPKTENPQSRSELEAMEKELHDIQFFILNTTLDRTEKIEQYYQPQEFTPAGELLDLLRERMRRRAARKDQQLIFLNPFPHLPVRGNSFLLLHCLENLVDNAVKYAPLGSDIQICARKTLSMLEIEVADHGPGINSDDQKRLFLEGVSLSAQPTGGEASHGMGLAVTRRVILGLGGTIEYQQREGFGAVFLVCLPLFEKGVNS